MQPWPKRGSMAVPSHIPSSNCGQCSGSRWETCRARQVEMPDGSSSAAPVMRPGPGFEKERPNPFLLRFGAVQHFHQGNLIDTALRHHDLAIARGLDIAHDSAPARDDPALELLGLDVEPHEHIRLDRRFDV